MFNKFKQSTIQDKVFWLIAGESLVIFIMAYSLSFAALYEYAMQHGYGPVLAATFAIFVDITLSYAVLSAMYKTLTSRHSNWSSLPIVVYSLFSLVLNMAHSDMTAGGLLIKLVIVVTLFYISETLREHVQFLLMDMEPPTEPKIIEIEPSPLEQENEPLKLAEKAKQEKTQARTIRIHKLNLEGLSQDEIAKREQVSPVTVKRHLSRAAQLNLNGATS